MQKTPPPPQLNRNLWPRLRTIAPDACAKPKSHTGKFLPNNPIMPEALYLLGLIENQLGRREQAVELIRRAATIVPQQRGNPAKSGTSPRDNWAVSIRLWRRFERPSNWLPRVIKRHYDLGNVLLQMQALDEAIAEFADRDRDKPAVTPRPIKISAARFTARGYSIRRRHILRRAVEIQPTMADGFNNLGGVLTAKMRLAEATEAYEQALKLRPDFATAMANLGSVLRMRGRIADAIRILRRAVEIDPNLPEAFNNLGIALKEDGQLDEAVTTYRKCLSLRPSMGDATNNLGNAYKDCGNVQDAVACYGRSLVIGFANPGVHSNLVYTLQFHPGYDDESLFREQRRWNEIYAAPLKHAIRKHDNDRSPDRKLRIGYVSPLFLSPGGIVLRRAAFEESRPRPGRGPLLCQRHPSRSDDQKMRAAAEFWHDVLGVSDADLAERIRRDRIDVLIDLAMHMAHNRMIAFAHKPAPVQAAWLAYPGGTGLDAMDYRITDAYMDPLDKTTAYYREQSYRIPDCWCCYDPCCKTPAATPRPDRPIRFGSINNPCKNNEATLSLWAKVMHGVSDSRLLMQAFSESDRQTNPIDISKLRRRPRADRICAAKTSPRLSAFI